jgi:quercetin dioxygenase-like cupin family protein
MRSGEREERMKRSAVLFAGLSLLLLGAILVAGDRGAGAQQQSEIQRKSLLQQDSTIPGYQAIMNIVEIPPGVREVGHTHPGPLAGYILEGTLVLEHEGRPTRTYKTGEGFLVEAGKIHQGINMGDVPVKILATLMVEKGKPATTPAP